MAFALEQGLNIIPCIGEKLEERQAGKTNDVCFKQLKAIADKVNPSMMHLIHVLYRLINYYVVSIGPIIKGFILLLGFRLVSRSYCV